MIDFIHTILLFPMFIVGWIVGYFSRGLIRGWYGGFYFIQLQATQELSQQLKEEGEDEE
jgi:hypothetical protein